MVGLTVGHDLLVRSEAQSGQEFSELRCRFQTQIAFPVHDLEPVQVDRPGDMAGKLGEAGDAAIFIQAAGIPQGKIVAVQALQDVLRVRYRSGVWIGPEYGRDWRDGFPAQGVALVGPGMKSYSNSL